MQETLFDMETEKAESLKLPNKGDSIVVVMQDDGTVMSPEEMDRIYSDRNLDYKPKQTVVFKVQDPITGKSYNMWRSSFSCLNKLKSIGKENNNTLVGLAIKVTRVEVSPNTANYSYEKVENGNYAVEESV